MTRQHLFFSIIVPTYNRPVPLEKCLHSLSQLHYPRDRFEVIVVDDGGRQNLAGVCKPYEHHMQITLIRKTNAGPASARNLGADHASGTHLAFTDDDCEMHPAWLGKMEMLFARYPKCMIGGQTINKLDDNIYSSTSQLIIDIVYEHYNAQENNAQFITSNNMAMPRDLFKRLGGFNLSFSAPAAEDRELCHHWITKGWKIVYDREPVIYHSHYLTLGGFCRQHFAYGRGAYKFRKSRRSKPLQHLPEEIGFHLKLGNWLLYPLQNKPQSKWRIALLLLIWQLANTSGFIFEVIVLNIFSSIQARR